MAVPTISSRIQGSLYGVACVDALGAPVEFCWRGSFEKVESLRYNPNFNLPPGSWTDDTSMTLCLAQSLVDQRGRLDARDQARKYVDWLERGYMSSKAGYAFDVGNATRVALAIWGKELRKSDGSPEQAQRDIDKSLDKPVRCGNGSLMRTAPIAAVFFQKDDAELDRLTAEAGKLTHPHILCVESCQVYVRLISNVLRSSTVQLSKADIFGLLKGFHFTDEGLISTFEKYPTIQDIASAPDSGISSSGYVLHTLEAALWAFFSTDNFREGAIRVVNLGDDADTVGAVYGGLAGAYYGVEAIPAEWKNGLVAQTTLNQVIQGTVNLATRPDA